MYLLLCNFAFREQLSRLSSGCVAAGGHTCGDVLGCTCALRCIPTCNSLGFVHILFLLVFTNVVCVGHVSCVVWLC